MLIPNLLGPGRPGPSRAGARSRRGYVFAVVLIVALSAGAVPAAAAEAARTVPGRDAGARAAVVLVRGPLDASGPGGSEAFGARFRGAREPLAPRRTRTLLLAVIGGAAGLAAFAVGGFVTDARRRGGYGRRPHG
ncbi:hypothetical protein [Streptomyces sp. ITFR-6]|uniref:hypothetical protein n=1 Tax=Streptomyces sp. ITFR-6 TaxID=3075197 RepID=UPI00288BC161|nr:hypothetical protein [Streptomyces sp. ITFR-6]WNI33842.1 hypothetical protein RLT59_37365 [Streptomyces sp. ITFR-6]